LWLLRIFEEKIKKMTILLAKIKEFDNNADITPISRGCENIY